MPIVKVIEVIASSDKSFDDAVKQAVRKHLKTLPDNISVWGKNNKTPFKRRKIKAKGVDIKSLLWVGKKNKAKRQ